jgi:hypothetical protein
MYTMVIGAALAVIFIGLPAAIIGLFTMSIADPMRSSPEHHSRRAGSEPEGAASGRLISLAPSAAPARARNRLYASLLPPSSFRAASE